MKEISTKTLNEIYFRYRKDSPYATHFHGFKSQLSRDIIEANGWNGNLKLDVENAARHQKDGWIQSKEKTKENL